MSDNPNGTPIKPIKPPRKRKSNTPRVARVIDPDIAALQKQHRDAVAALKDNRRSANITTTFLEKRWKQINYDDKKKIFDALANVITPPFPVKPFVDTDVM